MNERVSFGSSLTTGHLLGIFYYEAVAGLEREVVVAPGIIVVQGDVLAVVFNFERSSENELLTTELTTWAYRTLT